MKTKLIATVSPTKAERDRGAEVVFIRKDNRGTYRVLACECYEGWEQWGAEREVLSDNCSTVEHWRNRKNDPEYINLEEN